MVTFLLRQSPTGNIGASEKEYIEEFMAWASYQCPRGHFQKTVTIL